MTATLVQLDLESAAKEAVGNWQEFGSNFSWYRKYDLESPEDWAIFYTHHRDSDLLELSNAEVITEAMQPFSEGDNPDVVFETHDSWAVGHVDGLSVLVFRRGRITKAFRTYHELSLRLADYPVLDEDDYSNRIYEATLENITDAAWRVGRQYDLPDGWERQVFVWLSDHDQGEIENQDDRGGYPSEEALRRAFDGLAYERIEQ
jgi:hypothetical protein